ncbi:hypothetical protein ACWFNE_06910 [Cellulomonas sp. NPDC055163]
MSVTTTDGLTELADRLLRVRQRAWTMVIAPEPSVATLRDMALLAVAVHAHAAAFHAGFDGPSPALLTHGRTWQAIGRGLAPLRDPAPRDEVVRADLTESLGILRIVAPLSKHGDAVSTDPGLRRLGATFNGAARAMCEMARYNATTLERLARTGTIQLPARLLSGEEITDNPDLVHANLDRQLAPVPPANIARLTDLYLRAAGPPVPPPIRDSCPAVRAPASSGHTPSGHATQA